MVFSVFKGKKPVIDRCERDSLTKLRLRYAPYYHDIESVKGANVRVKGKDMVLMSSNEYLGLSQHPKVVAAAQAAVAEWGSSSCGSRLANGSRSYHTELEEEMAAFLGKEACHVLVAGYMSCMASLTSLAQKGDALIVDRSIHSALWDGVNLSSATVERFTHEDMGSLEMLLASLDKNQSKIIAVDGVYSMEGHIATMPRLVELANQYQAVLVVDDAHGFGVLGNQGRGVCDQFGVANDVDLIVGSFSKSLASTGGFIAGSRSMIEYFRTTCRQIIFSAAIGPAAAASALAALRVIQAEPEHHAKLWSNTRRMHKNLRQIGADFWESPTPAIPIVVGDKEKAYGIWKSLWNQGFFTVISTSPGVPVGKDLIRTAISALHTEEQIDRFSDAIAVALKKHGVKPKAQVTVTAG